MSVQTSVVLTDDEMPVSTLNSFPGSFFMATIHTLLVIASFPEAMISPSNLELRHNRVQDAEDRAANEAGFF